AAAPPMQATAAKKRRPVQPAGRGAGLPLLMLIRAPTRRRTSLYWLPGGFFPTMGCEGRVKTTGTRAQPERTAVVVLMPRGEKFLNRLDEAAEILVRASKKFLDMLSAFDRLAERAEELKDEEHACDLVVERVFQALGRSFVTPMDREDIHALATSLDNVLDNMEETAHRMLAFRIERPTPEQVEMGGI